MHAVSSTTDWITAVATGVGVAVAIGTIAATVLANRQRSAYDYVARLESPELIQYQVLMSAFLRAGLRPEAVSEEHWTRMDEAARVERSREMWHDLNASSRPKDRDLLMRILVYPNMLEGLASMYNRGRLDREVIKSSVEAEARDFWSKAELWWLAELRPTRQSNVFRDIEAMLEDLATRRQPDWYR